MLPSRCWVGLRSPEPDWAGGPASRLTYLVTDPQAPGPLRRVSPRGHWFSKASGEKEREREDAQDRAAAFHNLTLKVTSHLFCWSHKPNLTWWRRRLQNRVNSRSRGCMRGAPWGLAPTCYLRGGLQLWFSSTWKPENHTTNPRKVLESSLGPLRKADPAYTAKCSTW